MSCLVHQWHRGTNDQQTSCVAIMLFLKICLRTETQSRQLHAGYIKLYYKWQPDINEDYREKKKKKKILLFPAVLANAVKKLLLLPIYSYILNNGEPLPFDNSLYVGYTVQARQSDKGSVELYMRHSS